MKDEQNKKSGRQMGLESDPLEIIEPEEASVFTLIGFQIAKIAEGGNATELRRIVQTNMPKTMPEATAYVKQMERIRFAGEAAHSSAQEMMGSIPS